MVQMRLRHCATAVKGEGTPVEDNVGSAVENNAEYDGCRGGSHVVGTCGERGLARNERGGCDAGGPRVTEWCIKGRGKGGGHVARHMSVSGGQVCMERWVDAAVVTGGKGGRPYGRRAVTHAGRHRRLMLVSAGNSGAVQMASTCGDKGARSVGISAVHSVWPNVGQRLQRGWWDAGTIGLNTCGALSGVPRVTPVPRDGAVRRSIRVRTTRGYSMRSRGAAVRPTAGIT